MTKKHTQIREQKLLDALRRASAPLTIRELARAVFARQRPLAKADSYVRNALRRPRADGLVRQVGRGTYEVTSP